MISPVFLDNNASISHTLMEAAIYALHSRKWIFFSKLLYRYLTRSCVCVRVCVCVYHPDVNRYAIHIVSAWIVIWNIEENLNVYSSKSVQVLGERRDSSSLTDLKSLS